MKILDYIFCRLLYLYRNEKNEAIDSASNYLAAIILTVLISFIGTIFILFFPKVKTWGFNYSKTKFAFIIIPLFIILSYSIKYIYKKRLKNMDVDKNSKKIKFNLITLYFTIVLLILVPIIVGNVFR